MCLARVSRVSRRLTLIHAFADSSLGTRFLSLKGEPDKLMLKTKHGRTPQWF